MKRTLMVMFMLLTMSNSSLVYADEEVESSNSSKTESQFEEVTSQSERIEESNLINDNMKDVRWGKGERVTGVNGLTYLRDIYPMNFYNRSTLDLNYDEEEEFNSEVSKSARRFFGESGNVAEKYRYEWVKQDGTSFNYLTRENKQIYPGKLEEGFNVVKMRIKEEKTSNSGVVVDIPVFQETPYFRLLDNGTEEPKYALKILKKTSTGLSFPYYSAKELRRKRPNQINRMLREDLVFELYDVKTHKIIDESIKSVDFVNGDIEDEYARGQRGITIIVGNEKYIVNDSILIVSDELISDYGELSEWELVTVNDPEGVIVNPINESRVGIPNRGIKGRLDQTNGYILRDKNDFGMIYEGRAEAGSGPRPVNERSKNQIGLNIGIKTGQNSMKVLYPRNSIQGIPDTNWTIDNGFGGAPILERWNRSTEKLLPKNPEVPNTPGRPKQYRPIVDFSVTGKYYLKKGRTFLQIQVDPTNKVTYALSNGLSRNLNFSIKNEVYNNSIIPRSFGMVELADTDYYSDNVEMKAIGKHKGFTLTAPPVPENGNRKDMDLSVIIKDNNLNWLTDVDKYNVGDFDDTNYNPFGNLLQKNGLETDDMFATPGYPLTESGATGFALGTSWKNLELDEKLVSGYEVFLGEQIEYLKLKLNPKEKHIYQDQFKDIYTDFTVTELQKIVTNGLFEVTYPDGFVGFQSASVVNGNQAINGRYVFDRNHFPSELNPISGRKVTYPLKTIFVNESNDAFDELPSQEEFYNLHVYNLGATGILQQLKTNDKFSKKPEEIVTEKVYLPGHKIKYEYMVDGKVITKENPTVEELGLDRNNTKFQFVTVKMTDMETEENGRHAFVQVPFLFFKNTPEDKLFIYGEDFTIEPTDMTLWRDKDIDDFLIERSKAQAYNLNKNPAERLPVKVDRTGLPLNLEAGSVEEFKIITENPEDSNDTREMTIKITVGKKIEATANEQTILLGKKESELDIKDFVKDVKSFGQVVDNTSYDVKLLEKIPDVVTKENEKSTVKVEVSILGVPNATEIIEVPVKMTWGNSIAFAGDGLNGRMGGGAYTLHNSKTPNKAYISAVSGAITSDDNAAVTNNPKYSGKYLQIDHFNKLDNSGNYTINERALEPTFSTASSGVEPKQAVLDKWGGSSRNREVNHGDIIRSWSAEKNKQYISTDNKIEISKSEVEDIYYEVTKSGYRRLRFNQYKEGKAKGLIPFDLSEKELDKLAADNHYIELLEKDKNIEILGFKEGFYPDTSKPTDKNKTTPGTIVIREMLSSGKSVDYEVVVDFTITDGALELSSADNLTFGTQEVPSSDVYFAPRDKQNKVIVSDNRYEPKAWDLKATMAEPLHYSKNGETKVLKGSSILMLDPKGDKTLSEDAVVVYEISDADAARGENVIKWNNQLNEGYRLFVKNGTAKKDERYESTIVYSLDNKPDTKAVGEK